MRLTTTSTIAATSGTPVHAETTSRVCHSVDVGSRFSDLTGLVPAFTSARRESLVEKIGDITLGSLLLHGEKSHHVSESDH